MKQLDCGQDDQQQYYSKKQRLCTLHSQSLKAVLQPDELNVERGVEGALSDSSVSHQYVQVVPAVVLLGHPKRQHLLVQKQAAQVLLASLPLLF